MSHLLSSFLLNQKDSNMENLMRNCTNVSGMHIHIMYYMRKTVLLFSGYNMYVYACMFASLYDYIQTLQHYYYYRCYK